MKEGVDNMLLANGRDCLYLVWKEPHSRRQYVVGELEKNGGYTFRYCQEVMAAAQKGFSPLVSFPDWDKTYTSEVLFSAFSSRLPDKKRKDIPQILNKYGLEEYDAYLLLKKGGAKLPIDTLEFIDPILDLEKPLQRSFYIAGARYYLGCEGEDCVKAVDVATGDSVILRWEQDNPYDENAVQVLDKAGTLLGYIPRYYSAGVCKLLETKHVDCMICQVDKDKRCNECIKLTLKTN